MYTIKVESGIFCVKIYDDGSKCIVEKKKIITLFLAITELRKKEIECVSDVGTAANVMCVNTCGNGSK